MRFTAIIAGLAASLLRSVTKANPIDADLIARSDVPCYDVGLQRCYGMHEIVCMRTNGGLYWRYATECYEWTVCTVPPFSREAICEDYAPQFDCQPWCKDKAMDTEEVDKEVSPEGEVSETVEERSVEVKPLDVEDKVFEASGLEACSPPGAGRCVDDTNTIQNCHLFTDGNHYWLYDEHCDTPRHCIQTDGKYPTCYLDTSDCSLWGCKEDEADTLEKRSVKIKAIGLEDRVFEANVLEACSPPGAGRYVEDTNTVQNCHLFTDGNHYWLDDEHCDPPRHCIQSDGKYPTCHLDTSDCSLWGCKDEEAGALEKKAVGAEETPTATTTEKATDATLSSNGSCETKGMTRCWDRHLVQMCWELWGALVWVDADHCEGERFCTSVWGTPPQCISPFSECHFGEDCEKRAEVAE